MNTGERTSRRFSVAGAAICLSLVLVTAAIYLRAIGFGFIGLDDPDYVVRNANLSLGFTWRGLQWAFLSFDPDQWFPLTRLSHMLDYALFGLNAHWHHAVGVLFHGLASVLLYAFLMRATRQRWPSAFVAAVFALHPLRVESVAWVAERKDVLCAFFWFAALWAWVGYTQRPSKRGYFLTLSLFAAGLMSKQTIVTMPLLLPVLDIWPLRRPFSRRSLVRQLPFWALSTIASILAVLANRASEALRSLDSFPLSARVENALLTVFIYAGKIFWPTGLLNPYPWPPREPVGLAILAGLAIAGILALCLSMRRERPWLAAGWLWFLITLLPVIGLVQVGQQARADRYTYVPSVGLFIIVAWGSNDILRGLRARHAWVRPAATGLAAAVCLLLASLTWQQEQYWEDARTLFRHAIAEDGQNYLAWLYLGTFSDQHTDLAGRIECYRTAAQIRPGDPDMQSALGDALRYARRFPESVAAFEAALRVIPRDTKTRSLLGTALMEEGKAEDAIAQFQRAVLDDPASALAQNDLAVALMTAPVSGEDRGQQGQRNTEAVRHFKQAVMIHPDDPRARSNLGLAFLEIPGGAAEAVPQFVEVLSSYPNYVAAHVGLARALTTAPFSDTVAAENHLYIARQLAPGPAGLRVFGSPRFDYGKVR